MSIWNFMFPTIYYILIVFYQQQHFDFTRSPLRAGPQLNIGWNKGIHLIWNIFNRVTDNSIFQCKWSFLGYMIYIVSRMNSGERNSSENFVVILLFNHLLFSAPGRFCAHGLQVGKCVISKYFITDFLLSIVEWTISFLPRTFEELWKSFRDMKLALFGRELDKSLLAIFSLNSSWVTQRESHASNSNIFTKIFALFHNILCQFFSHLMDH